MDKDDKGAMNLASGPRRDTSGAGHTGGAGVTDTTLPAVVATLGPGRQARLRLGDTVILIDRRGEAWIALLECDVPAASGAPWTHGSDHGNGASGGGLAQADRTLPLQWLTLRGRHYLATWQREPFDDDTLRRFASALHAHRAR